MDSFDNLFNLSYLGKSNISLSKAILLFYLIIGNNYTGELFSGQLTDFVKNNRYAQHTIGYITMLIIINCMGGVKDIKRSLLYSVVAYLWFLFTTKLDLHWSLLIIAFMVVGLLYEETMVDKEMQSKEDEALEEEDKEKIINIHNKLKTGIVLAIMAVTLIGSYSYFNKKKMQYGGNFNGIDFMFGAGRRYKLTKN